MDAGAGQAGNQSPDSQHNMWSGVEGEPKSGTPGLELGQEFHLVNIAKHSALSGNG